MNRYTVKDERNRWLATIIVCGDGLVMLYGGQNGTYGHFWPGEMAFGADGIYAFLRDTDEHYAADKFTSQPHFAGSAARAARDEAREFIRSVWRRFVPMLGNKRKKSTRQIVLDEIKASSTGHVLMPSLVKRLVEEDGTPKGIVWQILLAMQEEGTISLSPVGRGNFAPVDIEWCPPHPENDRWWGYVRLNGGAA